MLPYLKISYAKKLEKVAVRSNLWVENWSERLIRFAASVRLEFRGKNPW